MKSLPEEQIQYSRRFAKLGGFLEKFHRHQDFAVDAKSPTKLLGWKSSSGRITASRSNPKQGYVRIRPYRTNPANKVSSEISAGNGE
jgi:hypothetical protein